MFRACPLCHIYSYGCPIMAKFDQHRIICKYVSTTSFENLNWIFYWSRKIFLLIVFPYKCSFVYRAYLIACDRINAPCISSTCLRNV